MYKLVSRWRMADKMSFVRFCSITMTSAFLLLSRFWKKEAYVAPNNLQICTCYINHVVDLSSFTK